MKFIIPHSFASIRSVIIAAALVALPLVSNAAVITEYFNGYGTGYTALNGFGTAGDGWAGAWVGGTTTSSSSYQPNSSSNPAFSFTNPDYNPGNNLTAQDSGNGFVRGGSAAGSITRRDFSSGLTGTVWVSTIVRLTASADILLWLDSGGSSTTNYVAFRNSRRPEMRINNFDTSTNNTQFSNNTSYLFLVKMEVNASGNDSLDFWIKGEGDDLSSETALGTEIYSSTGSDIFGAALNDIGFSFGGDSRADSLRISNGANGFADVTVIPEPSTLFMVTIPALLFGIGVLRRRR